MTTPARIAVLLAVALLVASAAGCRTAYYNMWETLGKEKRHLLKDNVEDAQESQEKAGEQFQDALTRIQEMYGFEGGDLEKAYRKLNAEYESSVARAEDVRRRIRDVEQVAKDLFREWEREIDEIQNRELRANSSRQLRETQQRYDRLHAAMTRAERSMDPVLRQLNDYVLYLKHNLNAAAVGSLKQEAGQIEQQVQTLVADIRRSVEEAQRFVKTFEEK